MKKLIFFLMCISITTLSGMEYKSIKLSKRELARTEKKTEAKKEKKAEKKSEMALVVDNIVTACKNVINTGNDACLEDIPEKDLKVIIESSSRTKDFIRELVQHERFEQVKSNLDEIIKFWARNPKEFYRRLTCVATKMYGICADLQIAHEAQIKHDFNLYARFMLMKIFFGATMVQNREAINQSVQSIKRHTLTTKDAFQEFIDELAWHQRRAKTADDVDCLFEPLQNYFLYLCLIEKELETYKFK